jgi:hypothetical protein
MITHLCDRCGRPLEEGELRYVARIEVFAAPDLVQVTPEELAGDTRAQIDRLVQQCEALSEEELMRDVYVSFKFDLCRRCQRAYLADPLAAGSA